MLGYRQGIITSEYNIFPDTLNLLIPVQTTSRVMSFSRCHSGEREKERCFWQRNVGCYTRNCVQQQQCIHEYIQCQKIVICAACWSVVRVDSSSCVQGRQQAGFITPYGWLQYNLPFTAILTYQGVPFYPIWLAAVQSTHYCHTNLSGSTLSPYERKRPANTFLVYNTNTSVYWLGSCVQDTQLQYCQCEHDMDINDVYLDIYLWFH